MNAKLLLNQYNTYFLSKQRNHLYTGKILNNQKLNHVRHYNIITQLKIFLAFHVKGWHWKVKCHTLVKYGLDMYEAVSHHAASSPIWMPAIGKRCCVSIMKETWSEQSCSYSVYHNKEMRSSCLKDYAEDRILPHPLRIEDGKHRCLWNDLPGFLIINHIVRGYLPKFCMLYWGAGCIEQRFLHSSLNERNISWSNHGCQV